MRSLFTLLLLTATAQAAAHPFNTDDLLRMRRLGDFDASPDGKWLVYAATTPHPDQNRTSSAL